MSVSSKKILVEKLADKYKLFCLIMGSLASCTIAIMILSTTFDATSRYLFNNPIPGVFELNEVLLVICAYMGLAWTQIERGHIRVTAVLMRVSPSTRAKLNILTWGLTFCLFFGAAKQSRSF